MNLSFQAPFAEAITATQSSCGTITVEQSPGDGKPDTGSGLPSAAVGGAVAVALIIVALLVI